MKPSIPDLLVLNAIEPQPEVVEPDAARVLSGHPVQRLQNVYSDADGHFFCGIWSCAIGSWTVDYSEHEFCHLLEGRVVITAEDGRAWRLAAGDAFVIPAGFRGTWETVEPCRKYYVIYDPRQA